MVIQLVKLRNVKLVLKTVKYVNLQVYVIIAMIKLIQKIVGRDV